MRAEIKIKGQISAPELGEPIRLAIVFADLAGYSRMMSQNETATLELIVECSHLIRETSQRYRGELVQETGDGFFLLFPNPVDALDFGVEMHRLLAKRQAGSKSPAQFRIGLHIGLVYRSAGMHHGHSVNVAARLEPLAEPGSCIVSQDVYDEVKRHVSYAFEDAGRPALKNLPKRIQVYHVVDPTLDSAPVDDQPVRIETIGRLTVRGRSSTVSFARARKQAALLGYLALVPARGDEADKVSALLWPDKSSVAARRALADCRRAVVQSLTSDLDRILVDTDGWLGLHELAVETDLDRYLSALRGGTVPPVLHETPDWPQRILQGAENVNPVFAAWLRVTRNTWQTRILAALTNLMDRSSPNDPACEDAARAVLALEPGNEAASNALIRFHAARGNKADALQEFQRLERYLHVQHGKAPDAGLRETVKTLRSMGETRRTKPALHGTEVLPATPVLPSPANRLLRVVVEPFGLPEDADDHLVAGFREDLIANLARFREWAVSEADGREGDAEADGSPDSQSSGHYVVRGTYVETFGVPALRIALTAKTDGRIVWSEDFALDAADWSAKQRDAVAKIAACLETYISADRLRATIGGASHDTTSHDEWLRAERIFARWTPAASDEAEAILLATIERDPGFAPAHSSIASFRNVRHVIHPGEARDVEGERLAHGFAERAVEIDPMDARNHLAMGWTAALAGTFDRSGIHLDLAASLNPNSPATLVSCAMGYAFLGQSDRAESLVRHVLRITPVLNEWQWCYIASVHFFAGRYAEALAAAERSGDRIIDNPGWTAAILACLGRRAEAKAAFDRLVEGVRTVWSSPDDPTDEAIFTWFTNAYPLRRPDDRARLAEALAVAKDG